MNSTTMSSALLNITTGVCLSSIWLLWQLRDLDKNKTVSSLHPSQLSKAITPNMHLPRMLKNPNLNLKLELKRDQLNL